MAAGIIALVLAVGMTARASEPVMNDIHLHKDVPLSEGKRPPHFLEFATARRTVIGLPRRSALVADTVNGGIKAWRKCERWKVSRALGYCPTSSTRRFLARPCSLLLVVTGAV